MSDAPDDRERCRAVKKDGTACMAPPVRDGLCIGHQARDYTESRVNAGHASRKTNRALKLLPVRLRPVVDALQDAFMAACAGKLVGDEENSIDKDNATLIAPLARALLACVQAGELEERVRDLEAQIREGSAQWPA